MLKRVKISVVFNICPVGVLEFEIVPEDVEKVLEKELIVKLDDH
jgi:hypothetical protein